MADTAVKTPFHVAFNTRVLFSTTVVVQCVPPPTKPMFVTITTREHGNYKCTLHPTYTPTPTIVVPHHIHDTDIKSCTYQLADWSEDGHFTRQNWDAIIIGVRERNDIVTVEFTTEIPLSH